MTHGLATLQLYYIMTRLKGNNLLDLRENGLNNWIAINVMTRRYPRRIGTDIGAISSLPVKG